ncbi:MAG: IS4 family transposase [Planctomycetes bacterium]|nr:IS4 family transposase [Planctomycetota bacterium]
MNLVALAPTLYLLFTSQADFLAQTTGFIRRVRGFDGRTFLQTLVFGWLRRPQAPLEHLAQGLGISKQALDQRFTAAAVAFCKAALLKALQAVFQTRPDTLAWLRFFRGVYVDDCTQLWLPAAACARFPATTPGQARLKVLLRWELQGGALHHLSFHAGRTGDLTALEQAPPLPQGCLHLLDLGFTDFQRLQAESTAGIFWITRLPAQTKVFGTEPVSYSRRRRLPAADPQAGIPLWRQLRQWRQEQQSAVDVLAWVGDKHPVQGRLIALACPPDVVARRLGRLQKKARRLGRPVSERQRELCHWIVLLSNVPAEQLTATQCWETYRLRWQIELLIKRFKSEGGLGSSTSTKLERVEAEWYLKLLGQVVRNWLQLLHGGPLRPVNRHELGRVVVDALAAIGQALRTGLVALWEVLWDLREQLQRVHARTGRQQQKTAAQRLQEAERAQASGPPQEGAGRPGEAEGRPAQVPGEGQPLPTPLS